MLTHFRGKENPSIHLKEKETCRLTLKKRKHIDLTHLREKEPHRRQPTLEIPLTHLRDSWVNGQKETRQRWLTLEIPGLKGNNTSTHLKKEETHRLTLKKRKHIDLTHFREKEPHRRQPTLEIPSTHLRDSWVNGQKETSTLAPVKIPRPKKNNT